MRRAGRITPSQQRALRELWPAYGVEFRAEQVDFDEALRTVCPVVLEIGFGNGETLVEQALGSPGLDFIGIEVHEPGIGHCLLKADEVA